MGMRYMMAHLGEDPRLAKNIHFEYYPAGPYDVHREVQPGKAPDGHRKLHRERAAALNNRRKAESLVGSGAPGDRQVRPAHLRNARGRAIDEVGPKTPGGSQLRHRIFRSALAGCCRPTRGRSTPKTRTRSASTAISIRAAASAVSGASTTSCTAIRFTDSKRNRKPRGPA